MIGLAKVNHANRKSITSWAWLQKKTAKRLPKDWQTAVAGVRSLPLLQSSVNICQASLLPSGNDRQSYLGSGFRSLSCLAPAAVEAAKPSPSLSPLTAVRFLGQLKPCQSSSAFQSCCQHAGTKPCDLRKEGRQAGVWWWWFGLQRREGRNQLSLDSKIAVEIGFLNFLKNWQPTGELLHRSSAVRIVSPRPAYLDGELSWIQYPSPGFCYAASLCSLVAALLTV